MRTVGVMGREAVSSALNDFHKDYGMTVRPWASHQALVCRGSAAPGCRDTWGLWAVVAAVTESLRD